MRSGNLYETTLDMQAYSKASPQSKNVTLVQTAMPVVYNLLEESDKAIAAKPSPAKFGPTACLSCKRLP